MNFHKAPTLERLSPLLNGLGPFQRYAIWVGNGILDVYLTDQAACGWRVPREAAFLLQLPSLMERYRWEEILKELGWQRLGMTETGFTRYSFKAHTALISTWPGEALNGRDRWYEDACFHCERILGNNGSELSVFSPLYLLATTLDSLPPREADLRYSESFARIAYLFAGRPELVEEIKKGFYEVRQHIQRELGLLLSHPDLEEALIHVLPQEEWYLSEVVIARMKEVSTSMVFS
ncbi:MAG: hypothetical protein NWR72_05170 [Bacteroidia bacterium]|nr:hypothetical protein [Bacteroidia bacterium]